jgi:DNA-directed RNA polymerase sigma subunit (sigma70/sigma32)
MLTSHLGERDRQVLRLWCEGFTLQAVGDKFSISKERVRQVVNKSITRMRSKVMELESVARLFGLFDGAME